MKTDDGRFRLDEGDMTIVLVWSECDLHIIDDTHVFVILLFWVNLPYMQCKVQWSAGIVQYLTPIPPVLTLVRNACSYQVCLH